MPLVLCLVSCVMGLIVFRLFRLPAPPHLPLSPAYERGAELGRKVAALLGAARLGKVVLPDYKWFGGLVEALLEMRKSFGIEVRPSLKSIRSLLIEDVKLERKRFGERCSCLCEFVLISLVTLVFYLCFCSFISPVGPLVAIKALSIQALGGVGFFVVEYHCHARVFAVVDGLLRSMMKLSVLSKAGLSSQKILSFALDDLPRSVSNREEAGFKRKLMEAVDRWKQQGSAVGDELAFQMAELDDYREYKREKFLRFVNVLKFACLGMFFLPGYLFLILELASTFWVE